MKFKIENYRKAFTLIELIVSMFIFMMVMGAMVAVSAAGFRSYGKSKAIKTVTENVAFAINSITKDARMGKIQSVNNLDPPNSELIITRNGSQETVKYRITADKLSICSCGIDKTCAAPTGCNDIVDLTLTGAIFAGTSGFRNQKTDTISATKIRGWVEINLNIENSAMETDSIRVQTVVSSRDYGWSEL
ncbi:MAG: prepilin-type N-terminal cleavage/methylation domain-containing protein [Parcubacteria group bacterium]